MSNSFTQLEPNIPVLIPGKGKGFAFAVIDYGQEHHLMWVVAMDDTGEIWTVSNPDIRVQNNWTVNRNVKPIQSENSSAFARHEPRESILVE